MNDRDPPGWERQKFSGRRLLHMILGVLALELFFFLLRQGAGWFHAAPLP